MNPLADIVKKSLLKLKVVRPKNASPTNVQGVSARTGPCRLAGAAGRVRCLCGVCGVCAWVRGCVGVCVCVCVCACVCVWCACVCGVRVCVYVCVCVGGGGGCGVGLVECVIWSLWCGVCGVE